MHPRNDENRSVHSVGFRLYLSVDFFQSTLRAANARVVMKMRRWQMNMKRFASLLLIIVSIACLLMTAAQASDDITFALRVGNVSGTPGSTVRVPVYLDVNTDGVSSLQFSVACGEELTLTGVENGNVSGVGVQYYSKIGAIQVMEDNGRNFSDGQDCLLYLVFTISDTAEMKSHPISITGMNAFRLTDGGQKRLPSTEMSATAGAVVIRQAGDLNLDGQTNAIDVNQLRKYLAKMTALDSKGLLNADVDGRTGVTLGDLLVLERYLADASVPLYLPGIYDGVQDAPVRPQTMKLLAHDVTGKAGETVTVNVDIQQNQGIGGVAFLLEYDTNALTIAQEAAIGIFSGSVIVNDDYDGSGKAYIAFIASNGGNISAKDGVLVKVDFTIKDTAAPGVYPIAITVLDANYRGTKTDENGNKLQFPTTISQTTPGSVTVEPSPKATISDVVVSGYKNSYVSLVEATITLTNEQFKTALNADTDISAWFTNRPGLNAKIKTAVASGTSTATVAFFGTPDALLTQAIKATIPASVLAGNQDLPVTANANAKWDIITAFAPFVKQHPVSQTVIAGQTATFTVKIPGGPTPSYQWKVSTDNGLIWHDVTDGTGGNTQRYTTPITTIDMNGYQYRCDSNNCITGVTSKAATLTVNPAPNQKYNVTVNGGTGGGQYALGASVTIAANPPAKGKYFKQWNGANGLTFIQGSANTEIAVFTMRQGAVTLTAEYADIPVKLTGGSDAFVKGAAAQDTVFTIGAGIEGFNAANNYDHTAMDGAPLDAAQVTAANGSILLTFKRAYLNTLSVGTHTAVVTLKGAEYAGQTVSIRFTVSAPPAPPKTGDSAAPVLWLALLAVACIGLMIARKAQRGA